MCKHKVTLYICKRGFCKNCSDLCNLTTHRERAVTDYGPDFDPETRLDRFKKEETDNKIWYTEQEDEE